MNNLFDELGWSVAVLAALALLAAYGRRRRLRRIARYSRGEVGRVYGLPADMPVETVKRTSTNVGHYQNFEHGNNPYGIDTPESKAAIRDISE